MGLGRAFLCILLPPLAVIHRGWGTVIIVLALTLAGWVPGVIAALLLNYPKRRKGKSKDWTKIVVIALVSLFVLSLLTTTEGQLGLGVIVVGFVIFRKYLKPSLYKPKIEHNTVSIRTRVYREPRALEQLREMHPVEFEEFIATVFDRKGYRVERTPRVADEGIDLIVRKADRVGIVQCKRYKGNVGQPIVRDLYGVMIHNRADEAFLITTGQISLPARTWRETKPIHLIDGAKLVEWMQDAFPQGSQLHG